MKTERAFLNNKKKETKDSFYKPTRNGLSKLKRKKLRKV